MKDYTIDDVQRDWDEFQSDENKNEANSKDFEIDSDTKAEWAIRKIKEAQEEHDRILALIDAEEDRLKERREKIAKKLDNDTAYLKLLLFSYMDMVKCKETKTQKSYQLLSGKLVYKYGGIDYQRDEEKLLDWTRLNKPEYVKIKSSVDWAGLKKELTVTDKGEVIDGSGEILDFIQIERKPNKLEVKFTDDNS